MHPSESDNTFNIDPSDVHRPIILSFKTTCKANGDLVYSYRIKLPTESAPRHLSIPVNFNLEASHAPLGSSKDVQKNEFMYSPIINKDYSTSREKTAMLFAKPASYAIGALSTINFASLVVNSLFGGKFYSSTTGTLTAQLGTLAFACSYYGIKHAHNQQAHEDIKIDQQAILEFNKTLDEAEERISNANKRWALHGANYIPDEKHTRFIQDNIHCSCLPDKICRILQDDYPNNQKLRWRYFYVLARYHIAFNVRLNGFPTSLIHLANSEEERFSSLMINLETEVAKFRGKGTAIKFDTTGKYDLTKINRYHELLQAYIDTPICQEMIATAKQELLDIAKSIQAIDDDQRSLGHRLGYAGTGRIAGAYKDDSSRAAMYSKDSPIVRINTMHWNWLLDNIPEVAIPYYQLRCVIRLRADLNGLTYDTSYKNVRKSLQDLQRLNSTYGNGNNSEHYEELINSIDAILEAIKNPGPNLGISGLPPEIEIIEECDNTATANEVSDCDAANESIADDDPRKLAQKRKKPGF